MLRPAAGFAVRLNKPQAAVTSFRVVRRTDEDITSCFLRTFVMVIGKAIPLQGWTGPEAPRFQDNRHVRVVRLSALRTGLLYPQDIFPVLISFRG